MKRTTLKILQDSLRMVITEGTGKGLNRPTVPPIAGKSGTAEAWKGKVKQNHAWFGAYAPADKPEIVVVAFAEHAGGSGSNVAGPMILQIMEDYFRQKLPGKDKSLLETSDNS